MKNFSLIAFICIFVTLKSFALETKPGAATDTFKFYGTLSTTFPVFAGAGFGVIYQDAFDVRISGGVTPEAYYKVIGEAAASSSQKESYKDVVNAAFQNNALAKLDVDYHYDSVRTGWLIGGSFSYLKSKGQAGIDKVLGAATGKDYTALKNLLTAAGKSTEVDMDSSLVISEIHVGYNWNPYNKLVISTTLGVAKVTGADINLQTGLPNFESSQAGSNLMRQSESDLEEIVKDQGISATAALGLVYLF